MLYAIFASLTAAVMVAVTMSMSMSSSRDSATHKHETRAEYLAEGAIETAKRDVAAAIANWEPVPVGGTAIINGSPVTYTVAPTGFNAIETDPAGIQTILTGYQIRSDAAATGHTAQANRLVNAEATPIFQFAVFYTDDLEINPGPSMTLGGRVHTNASMYLNCGNTLTVDTNYLRAVGEIYRHRKDDPSKSQGTVNVRNWVANPYDPAEPSSFFAMNSESQMSALGITTTSGYDGNFTSGFDSNGDGDFDDPGDWYPWGPGALEYWKEPAGYTNGYGHTVMSGSHGIGQAAVPVIGSIAMFEPSAGGGWYYDTGAAQYLPAAPGAGTHDKGYYHGEAGLSILTYEDGTWAAFDEYGTDITSSISPAVVQSTLYDARQGGDVEILTIDLDVLGNAGQFPANGLLYAAHYGAGTGTDASGVMLVEGSELASALTIVSENSVYIQGDYNTVNQVGAAVIGDAVNLLSNAWTGTKAPGQLPSASDTTYNVAIITGNQQTQGSSYNGGLENLPRFHEKWSNKNCNISGSFVNTWTSKYATGNWAYGGDRYKAPRRNWTYDTSFNTVANLPPYTPMAVTAVDVAVW